jgi:hypothetical protein
MLEFMNASDTLLGVYTQQLQATAAADLSQPLNCLMHSGNDIVFLQSFWREKVILLNTQQKPVYGACHAKHRVSRRMHVTEHVVNRLLLDLALNE